MAILEINNLCKTYPAFRLDNVSFDIKKGQITGFVGRNGAGKTTTIKSILNLIHPDSGDICFYGKNIRENEREKKRTIGYSTGSISWYPRKTIKQIIDIQKTFYDNWDEESYHKYLILFKLDENKRVNELSEGMKVKFNLLIALSHKADILILDEPTSGLDPFSRNELIHVFNKLRENGVAILFSTHIVSDLDKCADNIVYIKNGKIVASLSLDDFIKTYSHENETLEDTILRLEGDDLSE